jgi:hypothetical protein
MDFVEKASLLFQLVWSVLVPPFLAYVASAAYVLQKRRSDIEIVHKAMKNMRAITMLAIDRLDGQTVNILSVREHALDLISRVRLELLHRPANIQEMILAVLEEFLKNAEIADGRRNEERKAILERHNSAESQLLSLVRQLTVVEALKQALSNPGIKVSFDSILERFSKSNTHK